MGKLINAGTITFTDHDPGCLQLIEENIALNLSPNQHLSNDTSCSSIGGGGASSSSSSSGSSSSSDSIIKYNVYHLSWGKQSLLSAENAPFRHRVSVRKFPLIIGSDLIYCVEVVRLLLETVSLSMDDGGLFILATSFTLGQVSNHRCSIFIIIKVNYFLYSDNRGGDRQSRSGVEVITVMYNVS